MQRMMPTIKVNYKSDLPPVQVKFKINGSVVDVPDHDFSIRFFVEGSPCVSFVCSYKNGEYVNCQKTAQDTLVCYVNNHRFGCGRLCCEFIDLTEDVHYEDGVMKTVTPSTLDVELVDGAGDNGVDVMSAIFNFEPNEIASIEVNESHEDGGTNTVIITQTNGEAAVFGVKNGTTGAKGDTGAYRVAGEVVAPDFAIVDDLTTGGETDALSAEQGKVLKGITDKVCLDISETVPFSVTGRYYTDSGSQKSYQGSYFLGTTKQEIPEGCDRVRVNVRATTAMSAIAFYEAVDVIPSEEGWLVTGEGAFMKEYDAAIPEGAKYVASCDYDTSSEHSGVSCVCYNSKSIPKILSALSEAEERISNLEQQPDIEKAINPIEVSLSEVGYYGNTGAANSNSKGAHSVLVDIRGYTRCQYYGNIYGKVLVFFDSNRERITGLDVGITSATQDVVDLSAKILSGAAYMAFNCYSSISDFSPYWCKVYVPSTLNDRIGVLENKVGSYSATSKIVPLSVTGQYINVNGSYTTAPTQLYKHTGRINVESGFDRVRVQTCVYSTMCAIAWYDSSGAFINEASVVPSDSISHSTQVWDVEVPQTASYFIACTHIADTFKCVMYNSEKWKDNWIGGVLIFGDSISDNGNTIEIEDGASITYKLQNDASINAGHWQIDLASKLNIKDLRSYAKWGAHWCNFSGAVSRQQLSEQISLAIADSSNPNDLFPRDTFEPKMIIIALGTNDASSINRGDTVMGDVATTMNKDYGQLDNTIFFDAVRKGLEDIRSQWPLSMIYCSLPLQRGGCNDLVMSMVSPMSEICNRYGVRVINSTFESGICPTNFSVTLSSDKLHPTRAGQDMLSNTILRQL